MQLSLGRGAPGWGAPPVRRDDRATASPDGGRRRCRSLTWSRTTGAACQGCAWSSTPRAWTTGSTRTSPSSSRPATCACWW